MPLQSRIRTSFGPALWAAFLLGSPYVIGMRPFGGSASFSIMYPLIAAAMLAGMWISPHPSIADRSSVAARASTFVGILSCAFLVIPEWLDLALIGIGSNIESAIGLAAARGFHIPQALYTFSSTLTLPLALIAALSCGIYMQVEVIQPATTTKGEGEAPRTRPPHRAAAAPLILVGIGILQPIAWTLWLPHSSFPLTPITSDTSLSSLIWNTSAPLALIPLLEQVVACMCALHASPCPDLFGCIKQPQGHSRSSQLFLALLVGTIAGSVLVAAFPALRTVSQAEAICIAGIQAALVAALPVTIRHLEKKGWAYERPVNNLDTQDSPSPDSQGDPDLYADLLIRYGLTNREASAVAGHLLGFSSSQTAKQLGIQPSSVREYGRRACKKLGFSSLDEFEGLIDGHELTSAPGNCPTVGNRREAPAKLVAQIVIAASLMIALLPISGEQMAAGKALATVGGALLGLIGAGLLQAGFDRGRLKREHAKSAGIAFALASALLCVCLLALRTHNLPVEWGYGTLMACTAALVTTGAVQPEHQVMARSHAPGFTLALAWSWVLPWLTSLGMSHLSWITIPALLILGATLFLMAWQAKSGRLPMCFAVAASIAFGFLVGPTCAFLLLVTSLALFNRNTNLAEKRAHTRRHGSSSPSTLEWAALGIVAALVPLGVKSWLEIIAAPRLADNAYSAVTIIVGCIITLAALAECQRAITRLKDNELPSWEISPNDLQRIEGFLVSKGLTPRQVSVTLQSTQGIPLSEMGETLGLSKTAAYVSRREAFSTLGVRNTKELATLLQSAIK